MTHWSKRHATRTDAIRARVRFMRYFGIGHKGIGGARLFTARGRWIAAERRELCDALAERCEPPEIKSDSFDDWRVVVMVGAVYRA